MKRPAAAGEGRRHGLRDRWREVLKALPLGRIRSEAEYDWVAGSLEEVIAEIGPAEEHPLCGLLDILGMRLEEYDEERHPVADVGGVEMLRFLMDQGGLRQGDLPEIGSRSVVSKILAGRRELSVRQVMALARRFKVAPEVFLPETGNEA